MLLPVRVIRALDARISSWPKQKTAGALRRLRQNDVQITLKGHPIDNVDGRLGLSIVIANHNSLAPEGRIRSGKVAKILKRLDVAAEIELIKCLGLQEIDVADLFMAGQVQKALHDLLLGSLKRKRNAYNNYILGSYWASANKAGTQNEKNLAIKMLFDALAIHHMKSAIHSEETRKLAGAIARQMGLSEEEARNIELAALLHDIGKLGVARELLDKKGDLTTDEVFRIRNIHVILGIDILINIEWLDPNIISAIRHHHYYRLYPEGLDFNNPPLWAKIIAVADSFEAMTGGRIYAKKRTQEEAILELRNPKFGFDQEAVNALVQLLMNRPGSSQI